MKRVIVGSLAYTFLLINLSFGLLPGRTALALDGSDFQAGKIISDSNFFNGKAMNDVQIQQFLEGKVPNCASGYVCLKSYKKAIPNRPSDEGLCSSISSSGGKKKLASYIINLVGRKCGVSQKVLLVLLQKEQSLVTSTSPSSTQYRSATGYGCPDTAPCDSEYYGFFNQVYQAARIYKYYSKYPDNFNHIAGATNSVRYHPNAGCGSKNVYIANQATAGLYNYTPYTPNGAALNNLYGEGNGCSAYGNRNFWRIYSDWFGSTLSTAYPIQTIVGDWAGSGDGRDDIGFRRGNEYFFDTNSNGIPNEEFGVGKVTDKVFVGDWDGDGKDTIGLKRGNYYYLRSEDGSSWLTIGVGKPTDQVMVGDWDGNGSDTIGLKRGNYYYLREEDGTAWRTIGVGKPTDKVIVGDWDGDSSDSIGLRRGNYYYLRSEDGTSWKTVGYGRTTDQVMVGDWDNDDGDDLGLKRGNYYRFDYDENGSSDLHFGYGKVSDRVIVGDWDNDGDDNIGLMRYNRYYFDTDHDGSSEISFTINYF
ncbi:MAG TPA: hypothetical protein VJJ78_00585 [Candidatus Saccharimonadales bacterium]|nr:hypothetical protein [Candidatus Saccharimonadales bacterium]